MDIVNFDGLIAQGKILKANDINPNDDYLLVGKYNKRTKEFEATRYPPYAIKISDLVIPPTPPVIPITEYVYEAKITQSGTNPPTVVVMNSTEANYLGDFTWFYNGPGIYSGLGPLTLPNNKAAFLTNNGNKNKGNYIESSFGSNSIEIRVYNIATNVLTDGLLVDQYIQIKRKI